MAVSKLFGLIHKAKRKPDGSKREPEEVDMVRVWTGPIRLLPSFLIIGAAKSGTSSLYEYLVQHPCCIPAFKKEIHFFDLNFSKGLNWYRAHFPSLVCNYGIKKSQGQDLITGEASPYYIFHPLVPKRIAGTISRVKLIVLLRNPVDRAYSHYHHVVKYGFETLSFKHAIEAEENRLREEEERILVDEDYNSFSHRHHSYLARGIYINQVKVWMSLFPKEQILILSAEDFYADPPGILNRTFEFLNLPGLELKEYKVFLRGKYPQMDPAIRKQLVEYFEPHNQRLYDYLGVRFEWDK